MTWEQVTAVGTLAVAAVTAGLAQSTRILAKAANAEARANWQPVLVPEIDDDFAEGRPGASLVDDVLTIGVRNVGRGPALTATISLWDGDEEPAQLDRVYRGRTVSDVVPPGERLRFEFRNFIVPKPSKEVGIEAWHTLRGRITYGDVGYVRYETEIVVGFRIDGRVTLIDHRFLGATVDRMTRGDKLKRRALIAATRRDQGPGGTVRKRLAHRVARTVVKRLR